MKRKIYDTIHGLLGFIVLAFICYGFICVAAQYAPEWMRWTCYACAAGFMIPIYIEWSKKVWREDAKPHIDAALKLASTIALMQEQIKELEKKTDTHANH